MDVVKKTIGEADERRMGPLQLSAVKGSTGDICCHLPVEKCAATVRGAASSSEDEDAPLLSQHLTSQA